MITDEGGIEIEGVQSTEYVTVTNPLIALTVNVGTLLY
jgi:hypothetical protein